MRVTLLDGIIRGYGRTLKRIGFFVVLLMLTGVGSLLITLPLWLWATRARESYTLAVTVLIGITLIVYVVLKIWRNVQDRETRPRERLLGILKRLSVSVLFVVLLYGVLWLFASQLYAIAVPALVVYLLLLGFIRYAKKRSYPSS